jgi:hypothetical protein
VLDWSGVAISYTASPALDNGWINGHYKSTYGWNQWKLNTSPYASGGVNDHELMLSTVAPLTGLLYTGINSGTLGNWQTPLTCS